MPENRQFRQKLDAWLDALKKEIVTPVAPLTLSGCRAPGRLTVREARSLLFVPMAPGEGWGAHREYRWFHARFTLPGETAGKRVVLLSGSGGEQLVFLDERPMGSVDKQHRYVTLFDAAPSGGTFDLLIESYAGNGPRLEEVGPCPPERRAVPPTPEHQCVMEKSCLAVFHEDAYQLFMDADTLSRLWRLLPENSLRRQKIGEALHAFTRIADFELPLQDRMATFRRARQALRPALEARNGDSAPLLHIFGQSHIDLAWLWPLEETWHKAARTYANQLRLMADYPEYRFLACEPALMEMLAQSAPALYEEVLEKIRNGQIFADGAFYVECDTNIPSGESLFRQLIWGQKWFRKHTGAPSRTAWHPDTFGFSPALPQILKSCGVQYFATQKLLRADPECERFPYQDFIWEGADGSRVQAVSFFKNNARTDPDNLNARWEKDRTQQEHIDCLLYPFGFGDGGGGADRDMLEYLRREVDLEGLPRTEWHTLEEHFALTAENAQNNLWRGELYLPWHRGTYTAQRRTKLALYDLEEKLHDAEFLLALSDDKHSAAARETMHTAWQTLLMHQFHDIAAGACIREVHEEAVKSLTAAADGVDALIGSLQDKAVAPAADPDRISLVNTLPFPREEWVRLPGGQEGFAALPPSGSVTVGGADLKTAAGTVSVQNTPAGRVVSNGILCFILHDDGTVTDLTDLRNGLPLQDEGMALNDFILYRNAEPVYDAWELSRDCLTDPVPGAVQCLGITVTGENTPCLRAEIRYLIGSSPLTETLSLPYGSDRITFDVAVDWQERHKMLKVHFKTNIACDNALHGMQMCRIARPNHRSHAFAKDRYEVCQHRYTALFETARGAVLMNSAIYGISCDHSDMGLTLLRSPLAPDDTCDRGAHRFSFAFRACDQPFAQSRVAEEAYAFSHPPLTFPGIIAPLQGPWAEGALIETVKPADSGKGLVIRLWEHRGTAVRATLHLPRRMTVCACGADEANVKPLAVTDRYTFPLRAFEIRTMLLRPSETDTEA